MIYIRYTLILYSIYKRCRLTNSKKAAALTFKWNPMIVVAMCTYGVGIPMYHIITYKQ